jgi:Bifunctional DNA primase/polymerase, N-terminal
MVDIHRPGDPLQVRTLRHQLCAAGFCPIPLYGKEPPVYGKNNKRKGLAAWEQLTEVTRGQIDMWERTWPDALNTGALTRLMPALDLDILNEEAAEAAEALVRGRYEDCGYILVRIFLPPKRAVPFRTDEPFKKIVVNLIAPNAKPDAKPEKIEFLGEGQQVVVAGIHPDTKQPYRWHGGKPGQVKLEELPCISAAQARQLVEDIVELLIHDFSYMRALERPKTRRNSADGYETDAASGTADWQYLCDNIRNGHALHDSPRDLAVKHLTRQGPVFSLTNGKPVSTDVAAVVIADIRVVPVNDGLFPGTPQIWRWVEA